MSGWSRTVKPSADTTIVDAANTVVGVDRTEIAVTDGIAHTGWVHRKEIGNTRVVWEVLVAMKDPPVEDDADDTVLPDA